jgi:diguanylate cyclase
MDGNDFSAVKRLAERALTSMLEHRVPPTPRNYSVWYAHATGRMIELSRTIELMLEHGQEFTAERNDDLYAQFIASDPQLASLLQAGESFTSTLSRVLDYIEAASDDTRAYNNRLDEYTERLVGKPTLDGLRGIVAELAGETRRVLDQNRRLEDQLIQSSGEISTLRESLATVQREAMTDALTGIPNRSYFEQRLRGAIIEAAEQKEPLSLLLADIDHFKNFNDSYGHQLGDQVLRLVARTLTDSVKGRDTAARHGGEEFAILLPHTDTEGAYIVADQIRSVMMRRRIVRKNSGDELGVVTVSIGVSTFRAGESPAEFVARADAALYHAKRNGRNRVSTELDVANGELRVSVAR